MLTDSFRNTNPEPGICGKTHDEHAAAWRSFRDDCLGPDGCGFAMADTYQCANGHPDDGVTMCGGCGYPGKGIHDPDVRIAAEWIEKLGYGPCQPTCCGQRPPGKAGDTFISACQLCPKSPTYWRNRLTAEHRAQVDSIDTPADLIAACNAADRQADADVAEVLAEAAWDAADELAPYRKAGGDQ